jgi:hypothetical protein
MFLVATRKSALSFRTTKPIEEHFKQISLPEEPNQVLKELIHVSIDLYLVFTVCASATNKTF